MLWGCYLSGLNSSEMLLASVYQCWENPSKVCWKSNWVYLSASTSPGTYWKSMSRRVVQPVTLSILWWGPCSSGALDELAVLSAVYIWVYCPLYRPLQPRRPRPHTGTPRLDHLLWFLPEGGIWVQWSGWGGLWLDLCMTVSAGSALVCLLYYPVYVLGSAALDQFCHQPHLLHELVGAVDLPRLACPRFDAHAYWWVQQLGQGNFEKPLPLPPPTWFCMYLVGATGLSPDPHTCQWTAEAHPGLTCL